jgi:hypothetical protein
LYGRPVPWNGQRFRKVERNKEKMKRKAENAVLVKASQSCKPTPLRMMKN